MDFGACSGPFDKIFPAHLYGCALHRELQLTYYVLGFAQPTPNAASPLRRLQPHVLGDLTYRGNNPPKSR